MASVLQRVLRVLGRAASEAAAEALSSRASAGTSATRDDDARQVPGAPPFSEQGASGKKPSGRGSSNQDSRGSSSGNRGGAAPGRAASPSNGQGTRTAVVFDVASRGLPAFSYSPSPDGEADPGEVVWTWVPYEEDSSQGKDRPVLVLARVEGLLVVAQMTSKDHDRDAAQEARWGRYWHDVGSGPWDARGRPSEVRLDRLLSVEPAAVRREGATMPRATFEGVIAALRAHHS